MNIVHFKEDPVLYIFSDQEQNLDCDKAPPAQHKYI